MRAIILRSCFFIAIVVLGNLTKADAKSMRHIGRTKLATADTLATDVFKGTNDIQKHVFVKLGAALEREKLLDKLSKVPSDFPEFFANAKEEFLWREKVKAQMDANQRPATEPYESGHSQRLHVKNAGGHQQTP